MQVCLYNKLCKTFLVNTCAYPQRYMDLPQHAQRLKVFNDLKTRTQRNWSMRHTITQSHVCSVHIREMVHQQSV